MPNQKTVLRRSYFVIGFAFFVLVLFAFSIPSYSSSTRSKKVVYKISSGMLYYPVEDISSVYLDESLIDKPASDPVTKTDEDRIDEYVSWICEGYSNVTPELIRSVIVSESSYNPKATNGSHVGLMQVSTRWHRERARRLGVEDLYDPYGNILVGTDYLNELIGSVDGDVVWALMIYNMGHKTAYQLYSNGVVSSYASEILSRI